MLTTAQGSDHCPVYATFEDSVPVDESSVNILDIMNPPGMFRNGERQQEYTTKCLLPTSGRLIPEFDKRISIKDMFTRKPVQKSNTVPTTLERSVSSQEKNPPAAASDETSTQLVQVTEDTELTQGLTRKRSEKSEPAPSVSIKRSKSVAAQAPTPSAPGQKTLKGFFKPKNTTNDSSTSSPTKSSKDTAAQSATDEPYGSPSRSSSSQPKNLHDDISTGPTTPTKPPPSSQDSDTVIDPIASKEDWTKLFSKKPPPRCGGHQEPCISLTTKKPGVNCGRAFWICQRPVGPTGNKEKGTQWRCPTFIWASDWNTS